VYILYHFDHKFMNSEILGSEMGRFLFYFEPPASESSGGRGIVILPRYVRSSTSLGWLVNERGEFILSLLRLGAANSEVLLVKLLSGQKSLPRVYISVTSDGS